MDIIGQDRIIKELDYILYEVKEGKNFNLLLRAASGQGKTSLALNFLFHVGWMTTGEYILCGTLVEINIEKRIHVLDEVHLIENPENLYPYMDSGQHTFLFCTNLSGSLVEPLRNRCIEFIFDPYTKEEIQNIAKLSLPNKPQWMYEIVAENAKFNPRIASIISKRLGIILKYQVVNSPEELSKILENIMGIQGGLNINDKRYLEVLRNVRRASLSTISTLSGIDKNTIQFEIEPYLLYSGKIRITSRGREYVNP